MGRDPDTQSEESDDDSSTRPPRHPGRPNPRLFHRRLLRASQSAVDPAVQALLHVAGAGSYTVEVSALLVNWVIDRVDVKTRDLLFAAAEATGLKSRRLMRAGVHQLGEKESLKVLRAAAESTQDPRGRAVLILAARVSPDEATQNILLAGAGKGIDIHSTDQLIRVARQANDPALLPLIRAAASSEDPKTRAVVNAVVIRSRGSRKKSQELRYGLSKSKRLHITSN